jgi:hypothetical protein
MRRLCYRTGEPGISPHANVIMEVEDNRRRGMYEETKQIIHNNKRIGPKGKVPMDLDSSIEGTKSTNLIISLVRAKHLKLNQEFSLRLRRHEA